MTYQACIHTLFGTLGISCTDEAVCGVEFLPADTPPLTPTTVLANQVSKALIAYLENPAYQFDLPLLTRGTDFQQRVWAVLRQIPPGRTMSYAELAQHVGSGPRAVANACGANPIAIVIPCHRVVAKHGLGGFMQGKSDASLNIKRWLLEHERS